MKLLWPFILSVSVMIIGYVLSWLEISEFYGTFIYIVGWSGMGISVIVIIIRAIRRQLRKKN